MNVRHLFDPDTSTLTYVVYDPATRDAVVIDPVLDFDPQAAAISTQSLDRLVELVRAEGLVVHWVLETHAHADHMTGADRLRSLLGARVAVGARITEIQETFRDVFDLGPDFPADGRQFDRLVREGDVLRAGTLDVHVIETPGHTPACITYRIGDAAFTGDALFVEDYGTGRCDFPRGSADELYSSVHDKLYALPDATRVFVGHDYQPGGRPLRWETTIGESKRSNVQLSQSTSREDFVRARNERDATLKAPRLLLPSIRVNVDSGRLPAPRANGRRYLQIPLDAFGAAGRRSAPQPGDEKHARMTLPEHSVP